MAPRSLSLATDGLDDHVSEPEEDLADRSPAEFGVSFAAVVHTEGGQRLDRSAEVR